MIQDYDRQGNPISPEQHFVLFSNNDYRRVALTRLSDDTEVSTVWIGIDYNFGTPPPLIFETMLFSEYDDDRSQWRFPTEEAALEHHMKIVAGLLAVRAAAVTQQEITPLP